MIRTSARLHFLARLLSAGGLFAPIAFAQQQRTTPHVAYVYPAGAQQGTTTRIWIGGQTLNGASAVYITGDGVSARVVGYERPLVQREINDLREQLQKLTEKRTAARKANQGKGKAPTFTDADEKTMAEIRRKLAGPARRPANPGLAETVIVEVTLAKDATPGDRELRVKATPGLSNPFTFAVGQLAEVGEPVMTPTTPVGQGFARRGGEQRATPPHAAMDIKLPATVNGQILPGEVDRYRFKATKDQRLTIVVAARSLIPYLADAVPGWFQATVALYNHEGHEVAYADDFRFNPDPVLAYAIPADGEYTLEIKDSIYRGREDFVYRVAVGELPFVTSLFPLGCAYPERGVFELAGWNLPATKLAVETKDKRPGTFVVSVRNQGQFSNRVRFALDAQPDTLETEPNNTRETAQALTSAMIVNGRIGEPGDRDVFRVQGTAGATLIAEVFARRLNSPLDSILTVTDATGKTIAQNDDHEDKAVGLMTHQADSRVSLTLPSDGMYFIEVADTQHQGGPEYGYRLRVGPPRPDFELRVVPASINARSGTHVPITVYALRRDGFDGEISLMLRDAPRGFGLSGARIPAGEEKVNLTLWTGTAPSNDPIEFSVVGGATIEGRTVIHPAVPAEDMMQAFAYHHLVTMQRLVAFVSGRGSSPRLLTAVPVKIPVGGTARLELSAPVSARGLDNLQIELNEPPAGVSVQKVTVRGEVIAVVLASDAAATKAGTKGNLIMQAAGERKTGSSKAKKGTRVPVSSFPAIPFEIVGPSGPRTLKVGPAE